MKKINQSYKCTLFLFAAIFSLMLICNILTPFLADDFSYMNSFLSGKRITNIMQIFPSLRAHSAYMNGRLVAHFWAQFFLMLPTLVFDIVNSLMFTLQIFLLYRICVSDIGEKRNNNILILMAFGCIWLFQPAFGQVNFWLDGACNYLWAMTFGLLFILPFVNLFIKNQPIKNNIIKIIYPLFSLLVGAHSENTSAAFIFIAFLLLLATFFIVRKRIPILYFISIIFAVLGYLSLYLSPAQLQNKAAKFSLMTLRNNFVYCFTALKSFWLLLAIFSILLVLAIYLKIDKKHIILSVIFALGSMSANFIMTFAGYYAERSAFCVVALLVVAVSILFNQLTFTNYNILLVCLLTLLMLPTCYNVVYGVNDVYNTYLQIKANEEHIYQCKNENNLDVSISSLRIETKYSGAYTIHYVDPTSTEAWPNNAMSQYYGVNTIIGK